MGLGPPCLILSLFFAIISPLASAELVVFVDGRVLKVDDAFLRGENIILVLPDSGRIEVPAVRIDRVVSDEVAPATGRSPKIDCAYRFNGEPLPETVPFSELIQEAAKKADLHPWLLVSLVRAESAFDPQAVSRVGASGLTQLMPAAAADQGVADVFDPEDNLQGGAQHLRGLLDRFDTLPLALAAYNAGATTVDRYGGIPPYRETQEYVERVLEWFCPTEDG